MTAIELHHGGIERTNNDLDREQIELIKRTMAKESSDDELALFVQVCNRTGLDPFARQIYAVMRNDKRAGRKVMSIQTSIDGYRLIAQRSRDYAGQIPKQWCGSDGVWVDVWLKKENPAAAKAGVYRKGFAEPLVVVATWSEYAQTFPDGNASGLWKNMPALMLAKCAEASALRSAFPAELSGLYTQEEMSQADVPAVQHVSPSRPPALAEVVDTKPLPANVDAATGEVRSRKRKPPSGVGGVGVAPDRPEKPKPATPEQVADITELIDGLKEAGDDWKQRGLDAWHAAGLPSVEAAKLSADDAAKAYEALSKVYVAAVTAQPTLDGDAA